MRARAGLMMLAAAFAGGCDRTLPPPLATTPAEMSAPAGMRSGEPNLAVGSGRLWLSWLEAAGDSAHALRFAAWDGATWSSPGTVVEDAAFFVNWADFPSMVELEDGSLAAHWLARTGGERYAYAVRTARSTDGGATWSEPVTPHDDGTPTEHGFVSLMPMGPATGVAWLDGRGYFGAPEGEGVMALRFAEVGADGRVSAAAILDARACDCCQTDAARTDAGYVVVYRDRSPDEIRDISLVRYDGRTWSEPVTVHDDGWEIPGCPVNGPAVAAAGDRVAVAWFTAAADSPRVRVAFSEDGGATFAPPVRIDEGAPVGRVDLLALDGGDVLVSWLERIDEQGAEVRVRRVSADGRTGPFATVSRSSAERASGFPRMARLGDAVLFAWTDPSGEGRVRTAAATLPR